MIDGLDQHAAPRRLVHQARDIEVVGALHPEHGPALARRKCHPGRQIEVEGMAQGVPALPEGSMQVRRERVVMSQPDEVRHRALVVARRLSHHQPAQLARLGDQLGCRHHEAETQARCEHLGQARHVDDAVFAVHAAQRRVRISLVVALAVEVVLDDEHVALRRLLQQGPTTLERHRDARRRLVAGGHINDATVIERCRRRACRRRRSAGARSARRVAARDGASPDSLAPPWRPGRSHPPAVRPAGTATAGRRP